MKITNIDVETPHAVSWETDEFGVIIRGVSKFGIDCTHELTDAQLEGIRHSLEAEIKRDREDAEASAYYSNAESRAELANINANRWL